MKLIPLHSSNFHTLLPVMISVIELIHGWGGLPVISPSGVWYYTVTEWVFSNIWKEHRKSCIQLHSITSQHIKFSTLCLSGHCSITFDTLSGSYMPSTWIEAWCRQTVTWDIAWSWKMNWLLKCHGGVIKDGQLILSRLQKIKDVFIWKNKCGFSECQTYKYILMLQAFLRQNIMTDSGSSLCDVWPMNCCSVALDEVSWGLKIVWFF